MFGHFNDNISYLERKYRQDSADPATGLANEELTAKLLALERTEWRDLSRPMKKAEAFTFLCRNMRIDASPHDFFPTFGCWNRDARPMSALITRWQIEIRQQKLHFNAAWETLNLTGAAMLWIDFDHSVPDWDALFALGFPGILQRAQMAWQSCGTEGALTGAATEYFKGICHTWEAALRLLDRFAACAAQKAEQFPACAAMYASLARLRKGVPENTYDALMLIYLYFFLSEHLDGMQTRSLGNLDDRLWPFTRRDLEEGRFTEAQIRELLAVFFLQWGSINNYWGQPFYLGGSAADGSTLYNPASRMILEEYGKLDITSPKIQMKIAGNTPDAVLLPALALVRQNRNMVFVGEAGMAAALKKLGFQDEEARRCDISGCYEYCPRGTSVVTAVGYVNLLKPFETLLSGTPDSFEQFLEEYWRCIRERLEEVMRITDDFEPYLAEMNPAQIFSATIGNSLKTARDAFADGSVYNNTSLLCSGFGSSVDALAVVRKFVYEEHVLTLDEWRDILKNNWRGAEAFRQRVLNFPARYGNHCASADAIAAELARRLDRLVNGRPNARGGIWFVSSHGARTFILLGGKTEATPDGRLAGEEMSKNLSPVNGMDRAGVTALLESAVQIGGALAFPGDACVDVMLHPSTVAGAEGLAVMKTLLFYYMEHGGHALQFNIFDPETLRDAQNHPEKYSSLMVRVSGWNTRFNDMARNEQNAYIERALNIKE